MPAKSKVTGQEETARAFDKLEDDIKDMTDTHDRVMRARIPGVASRTHVNTGELRGSWDVEAKPDSGTILSPLPYSVHQEYGTKYIAPVAMVAQTLEAEQEAILREYEQSIKEAAKRRGFRVND